MLEKRLQKITMLFCTTVLVMATMTSSSISQQTLDTSEDALGNPPRVEWDLQLSGDFSGSCQDIFEDDSGSLITAGTYKDKGDLQAYLAEISADGQLTWMNTYGGLDFDGATDVVACADGGLAFSGCTLSFGEGFFDAWMVKTDADGKEQWNRSYGAAGMEVGSALLCIDDGYMLAGTYRTKISGQYEQDFWLINVDEQGNERWNYTYHYPKRDYLEDIVQCSDGGYLLVGYNDPSDVGVLDSVRVVRTDAQGVELWNNTFSYTSSDGIERNFKALSVVSTENDEYIITGTAYDLALLRIDDTGSLITLKTFSLSPVHKRSEGYNVASCTDGGFIITGYMYNETNKQVLFVLKTDGDFSQQWLLNPAVEDSSPWIGHSIVQTEDTGYALVGLVGFTSIVLKLESTDHQAPSVEIISPGRYIYVNNRSVLPFFVPVVVGPVEIAATVIDDLSGIKNVTLHINDELVSELHHPMYRWYWEGKGFGRYKLKVTACDYANHQTIKEVSVWKIL